MADRKVISIGFAARLFEVFTLPAHRDAAAADQIIPASLAESLMYFATARVTAYPPGAFSRSCPISEGGLELSRGRNR
jgi:hypothetical protein